MALERWLLELAGRAGVDIEGVLLRILRESNNGMTTAVVASVCSAFPEKGKRAAVALLTSRDVIELDRGRMVSEHGASFMAGLFGASNAEDVILADERKKADALPHRQRDLEALARSLQLGPERDEVWRVLDRHREQLPPREQQTETHRIWRLALHRMDLRGFEPVGEALPVPASTALPGQPSTQSERLQYFAPAAIEPDVQEMVDRATASRAPLMSQLALLNWASAAWERRSSVEGERAAWRTKLDEARQQVEAEPAEEYSRGAPELVAAICVRDYWSDLEPSVREWCTLTAIREIARNATSDDWEVRVTLNPSHADRAAAHVLPLIMSRGTAATLDPRILGAIGLALTHASSEVQETAADAIGLFFTGEFRQVAVRCAGAIAYGATLTAEREDEQARRPPPGLFGSHDRVPSTAPDVREAIERGDLDAARQIDTLELTRFSAHHATTQICRILGRWPDTRLAQSFFRRIAEYVVSTWDEARDGGRRSAQRDFQFDYDMVARVAGYSATLTATQAVDLSEPFQRAVEHHPDEVVRFVRSVIGSVDVTRPATHFWAMWVALKDKVLAASWLPRVDSRSATGGGLVNVMLLAIGWNRRGVNWPPLTGHESLVEEFAKRLPPGAQMFRAYCNYLYYVGAPTLPGALTLVADILSRGTAQVILRNDDTMFCLEAILSQYVYGEPMRLKASPPLRHAVLQILDDLVEAGSSAAYRLRDDFVTPIPSAATEG